ncbi:hypothetical protein [Hymenobacter sp. HDW8]|uniref:hypothetical protein n=1 Tax=Hymenobacter sp. HDW8 TaxID=2714932 RepID=UPI00140A2CA5|nr:hypothetical protein [Hymenobacter sp. HDW8]QIL75022.1 hypothetical protein G7064_03500 [Hymenobacter sp. HDW8]
MDAAIARAGMEEKYAWAAEVAAVIDYEALDYKPVSGPDRIETDETKVRRSFWTFLQAYQQLTFYHGKWRYANGIRNQATKYVDRWRLEQLTPEQSKVWGLLNRIRTIDTHQEPVMPTLHVQFKVLGVNGRGLVLNGNLVEVGRRKTLEVQVGSRYYELTNLTRTGLKCMRLFIDTFDQINSPLQEELPDTHDIRG